MVSNASDDLPEPATPGNTINWSRGSSRSTLRRLCSRAPRITIELLDGTATGRIVPGDGPDRTNVRSPNSQSSPAVDEPIFGGHGRARAASRYQPARPRGRNDQR